MTAASPDSDELPTVASGAAAVADRDGLRVATYNVRYAGVDDGALSWERRRDGVARTMRSLDADAIAVQECWLTQLEDLRTRLPRYDWVAYPDRSGEHTPIAFRRDRLQVEASGAFGLAPDGERDVLGWDARYPRTVTHATLRVVESDLAFALFSVHLDHSGARARVEGARLVLDRLPHGPAVVAGDLNCRAGSEPYRVLAGELADAATVASARDGPEETYVGFGGDATDEPDDPEPKRIDYVLVRAFDVNRYRVVPPDAEPVSPSDHRPVVADLVPHHG